MAHQRARLYDREAERYDRSRPSYPDALVDHLVGPSPEGLAVLDVACGTGIAACLMAQRGAQVLGVEGDPAMAAVAARHGIAVEVAEFERWEPAGRTFDLVTCAQAWHWLDVGAAAAKAASVLRPGGRLCVFWTVGFHPGDLDEALAATYRAVLPPDGGGLAIGCASNDAAHAAASAMENTPSATNCSPPACSTRPRRANSVGGGTTPGNCGSTSSPRTATAPHSSRGGGSRSWPQSGRRSTVSGAPSRWNSPPP